METALVRVTLPAAAAPTEDEAERGSANPLHAAGHRLAEVAHRKLQQHAM